MTKTPASDRRTGMDALSDVLRVAHLTGDVFLHADFFAPWCMAARVAPEHCAPALGPASHLILYHYVVEGELIAILFSVVLCTSTLAEAQTPATKQLMDDMEEAKKQAAS